MKQIVPPIQTLKQRSLDQPGGETTMSPSLIALRGNRVIATVTAPRLEAVTSCAQTFAIGLAPQMLVITAQVNLPAREATDTLPAQAEGEGIAYTLFTADKEASLAVQRYAVRAGQVVFGPPERGRPDNRTLMDELARAMAQEPLDPAKVARKDEAAAAAATAAPATGQRGTPNFIPVAEGRIAIDAGTVKAAYGKVIGIGGSALYIAADGAEATRMLAAGLPKECLLS